jgi:hypothetical protein
VLEELLEDLVQSSRGRTRPRGVKRKMSGYKLRPRGKLPRSRLDYAVSVEVLK